jgi:hypothetical protein
MNTDQLYQFCDVNKPSIRHPFSEGDYTFATDGKMCIRLPRMPDVAEREDAPRNVSKNIFDGHPNTGKFMPLEKFEIAALKGNQKCEHCMLGKHLCDSCDTLHDCGKCDGTGEVEEDAVCVWIGKHKVSHLLLHKIKSLPNVQIAENAVNDLGALTFKFDGGEGVLMPLTKDH